TSQRAADEGRVAGRKELQPGEARALEAPDTLCAVDDDELPAAQAGAARIALRVLVADPDDGPGSPRIAASSLRRAHECFPGEVAHYCSCPRLRRRARQSGADHPAS